MKPTKARLTSGSVVETLDAVALKFIGDDNDLNVFFVVDEHGHVETVSFDFDVAYRHWSTITHGYRRGASLEDRQHGVLAWAEYFNYGGGDRFDICDDTVTLGVRS